MKNHCLNFVTDSDVEKITGLKGVLGKPQKSSGFPACSVTFKTGTGQDLLSVDFVPAGQYETYKAAVPGNFKAPVIGVGEEAFIGPDIDCQAPYRLVFRKKAYTVALMAATTADAQRNTLSLDQLIALGSIIASRLD